MAVKWDEPILEVAHVSLNFRGVQALSDVSLSVSKGEIVGIIGPNGAGKTSLLNCINGVYHPQKGNILLKGENILPFNPSRRAAMGIGRTFQHVELFKGMTVLENIKLGAHTGIHSNLFGTLIWRGKSLREELKWRGELERKVIDFLDLSAFRWHPVGLLPQGLQKRVDLGRALAMYPELLLLDEPMAGMNVEEKEDMSSFLMDVHRDLGTTIVWIEHDLKTVKDLSDRVYVLNFGSKIADGPFWEVKSNPQVIEAYLGMEEE